jgi:hypothetical protein
MSSDFQTLGPDILRYLTICKATYNSAINHRHLGFTRQRIIHGVLGRGFCRVFWNQDEIVVAFRGTREVLLDCLFTNFLCWMSRPEGHSFWSHYGFNAALRAPNRRAGYDPAKTYPDPEEIKEIPAIQAVLKLLDRYRGSRKLTVTGHSLGGALAVLAALHIAEIYKHDPISAVYTYGQPAVGGATFCRRYESLGIPTYRIVHGADLIPHMPPFAPYRHVGKSFWISDGLVRDGTSWPVRMFYNAIHLRLHLGIAHHLSDAYEDAIRLALGMSARRRV